MPLARLLRAAAEETAWGAAAPAPVPGSALMKTGPAGDDADLSGALASLFDWSFRDELDTDWGRAHLCRAGAAA